MVFLFLLTKSLFEEVEHEFRQQLAFLRDMGAKIIGASEQSYSVYRDSRIRQYSGRNIVWTIQSGGVLCTGLNRLGRIAKGRIWHFADIPSPYGNCGSESDEVKRLMENTEPEYVSLLLIQDILLTVEQILWKWQNIHAQNTPCSFKRYSPGNCTGGSEKKRSFLDGVRIRAFTIPGDGAVNFEPIFQVLECAGYEGYMVVEAEQDPAKANPFEYALKARKFIREKQAVKLDIIPLIFYAPFLYHRWYKRGRFMKLNIPVGVSDFEELRKEIIIM